MSNIVIKATDISKQYRLGLVGTGTLKDDMARFWAKIRGKEDPTLTVGQVNDRTKVSESDYVWALKDINFEVKQGEILGIIGKNGAGKSTLLKILSKITAPTTGSIKVKGRIASLLEVGTGFHGELTGRENIYVNGAVLGMTKREVTRKLDEIVDFAGVEKYMDTPVKRYSSGMTVRLGFAVAAHLDPDILVVDEVLTVGDAEFQKKAIGKMQDVSTQDGRTILFVSHNMGSVLELCSSSILLKNGQIDSIGKSIDIVEKYFAKENTTVEFKVNDSAPIFIKKVQTCNSQGEVKNNFAFSEEIRLRITIGVNKQERFHNIGIGFLRNDKKRVFTVNKSLNDFDYKENSEITIDFIIEPSLIAPMNYSFLIALNNRKGTIYYEVLEDVCPIKVYDDGKTGFSFVAEGSDYGCIIIKDKWDLINKN